MVKDKGHKTVKILIETGNFTTFAGIFEHIPKTTVADELGIHFSSMARMIASVKEIEVNDTFLFSTYFEIDPKIIFELAYSQYNSKKLPLKSKK
jgi:hypothetical protein